MRILYVEDNEVNRALVERIMRARQCEVIFRDEGEGALEVLKDDPKIDLVLLDIDLAGTISGLDVIRTLRARNDHRPVVAITAYAMMGDRERILEAGCDQYLPKPLVVTDLLAMIDHYEKKLAAKDAAPAEKAEASVTPATPPKPASSPAEKAETVTAQAAPSDPAPAEKPEAPATPPMAAPDPPPSDKAQPPANTEDAAP